MTGCGRSVGAYVRTKLLEQGHSVYGVGLDGPDFHVDFAEASSHTVVAAFQAGPFDVLINNAAVTHLDYTENHTLPDFIRALRVNLEIPYALCRRFIQAVIKQEAGVPITKFTKVRRIINVSSMGTAISLRASAGYCASKAGLEALTRMMAKEFAGRYPIICCCIAPGSIEGTDMLAQVIQGLQDTRGMDKATAEAYAKQSPLGRHCTYEEVWKMFDFCVNHMPAYCSGEVFRMMGGMGVMT